MTTEELADGICLRAGRIAAAEAEQLPWIAEFDRREGWAGTGMLSCAHWLSWRIGLSLGAAREQVRVARRLEDLPELASGFGEGRISYSKVRAITRVATPGDGIDWAEHARHSSAAQLEQIVRGVRRAQANAAAELDPEAASWSLRTRVRYDDAGNFTLTISGPAEHLPVIQAGIEAKKAELQRQRDAESQEQAQALALALAVVPADASPPTPQPHPAAHPDAQPGAQPEPGIEPEDVPAETSSAVDLDEQAPGWPQGTTRRAVRAAAGAFLAAVRQWHEPESDPEDPDPTGQRPAAQGPDPAPTAEDVPAETSGAAKVTEAEVTDAEVTDAQALLALAQDALAGEQVAQPGIARRRRPQLTAQIDPISGWGRLTDGELLPPSSLRAVMRSLPGRQGVLRLRPVTTADLRRHDLGRTSREANAALRELLGTIDGERCRFPGCTRHKKLHAHHVLYWSAGGSTDLDNLVLVCSRHHTLIHSQDFGLVLHPDRRLDVATGEGMPLLHHPAQPWTDPAALASGCGQLVSAETLQPDHCNARMDLGYVVSVLMAQAS